MTKSTTVLAIASDHGGFEMKEFIKKKLIDNGYIVKDFGTYSKESVDYPDVIHPLAKAINDGEYKMGIIMCGTGNGAQITANKYANVRAGLCWNEEQAMLIRLHNNANIISLPGRFLPLDQAWKIVEVFLSTNFEGGRHIQRVNKISKILK
ncbi:MAG: ribose 5-phosphate isomerase B [Bacteroidetes bacterium]|nr:ribose 5-phosphate isomerase B [Bacteroidota bacterium]MBL6942871.1 ribose 5-phosphate isomerase B [Bacteroidales bacterium]